MSDEGEVRQAMLRDWVPHGCCECPECHGTGTEAEGSDEACATCNGDGWRRI